MDQIHFTTARNARLDAFHMTETAFYNTHSFERWHRFVSLTRHVLAWRLARLRRVQPRQNKLRFTHAR